MQRTYAAVKLNLFSALFQLRKSSFMKGGGSPHTATLIERLGGLWQSFRQLDCVGNWTVEVPADWA
jgi:hypothetical protein